MANDNKISVDVSVSGDGQKQIDNYVKSFDNLRNSINGLSKLLIHFRKAFEITKPVIIFTNKISKT